MSIFKDNLIRYCNQNVVDWQQGVELASNPLIENNYVDYNYVKKIIALTNEQGPYYVIAPKIALLHIAPNEKIKENAISFTYFKNPIIFKDEERYHVNYCLALVAKNGDSHLDILRSVANLFSNQVFLQDVANCNTDKELINTIRKYDI